MTTKPNPGTKEALDAGCECPIIDNHYGKGIFIDGKCEFWIAGNCPIHGFELLAKKD